MSETSDSLQVRTDAMDGCVARLQELGFNGFVFRGAKGWLTVVPYGGPEGIMVSNDRLARFGAALAAPVLRYHNNDFGWGFQFALPDGRTTAFDRFSAELLELAAESGERPATLDEAVVSGVVPQVWIDRLVQQRVPAPDDDQEGRDFARDMGVPQYSFLSPSDVTDDPDDALGRGGQEIGTRPQLTPAKRTP